MNVKKIKRITLGGIDMNKYLMRIKHYFSGWTQFEIEAENKQDAVVRAKEYCRKTPEYSIGKNYDFDSIECIKKLRIK